MGKSNHPAAGALTIPDALRQAYAHWNAGQAPQAELLCLRVLEVSPDQPDARHLLGLMAHAYGRPEQALAHLRAACQSAHAPSAYHSNLAEVCRRNGLPAEAQDAARRAVAMEPGLAEGWNNLGIILQEAGQLAASLECLQRVAALLPDSPEAHNNLGNTHKRLGNGDTARAHYRRALELNPDHAQALSNLALTLKDEGRHEEALAAVRRAIDIDPQLREAHRILAEMESPLARDAQASGPAPLALSRQLVHALRPQGMVDESRRILETIVRAAPDDMDARFDLAEILLLQGDFEAGWREYRFRYRLAHTATLARHVQKPRWEGQPIAGQTLLIHDEQGYGDTFQFLQLLAWARQRSGARVVLEVNAECHALARRGGGFDEIIREGEVPPPFDFHCELMSLPLALGLKLGDLPVRTGYLRADPARIEHWRNRLAALPRPLVGLAWAGRPAHANDARRSLALADLAPLARNGLTFVGLQKGPAAAQAATPPAGIAMVSLSDEIRDFDDTAAILTLLDVLVSVDSSPAHLAGALGCPAWIMLPFAPDWRWLLDRDDTPWYPSVRLFRQAAPDAWGPVLGEIAAALDKLRDGVA